ncbi:MAG: NUDIX hydrolase [Candidatus Pacebacteria bacterium]|nr:NUDIX hydrolase [Candidatus Paceibacterota bacterium]
MQEVIPLNLIHKHKNRRIKRTRQSIVASGILMIDSKALLLKRGPNNFPAPATWILPAGHVEPLETPEKAVVREFKEETNIDVMIRKLIKIENYFYDSGEVRNHLIEFIYHVIPLKKDFMIKLDKDHVEYDFAPVKNLSRYASLVAPRKKAIREAYKNL